MRALMLSRPYTYHICTLAADKDYSSSRTGTTHQVFIFFNNRMGCLRSLIVSAILTLLLLALLGVLRVH